MNLSSIKKFASIVNTVILLLVFGLTGFFKACDVSFLTYFSIPTAMVYIFGFYLIHKGKLTVYVRMVYFWLTLYMGVTTLCLGYGYGFHLYCFSMIPTIFVAEYISFRLKKRSLKSIPLSIAICIFYILCTGYVAYFGPLYHRDQKIAAFFWIFNALCVFGFLIFYANFLVKSIIDSEKKLTEAAHIDRLTKLYNRHYMLNRLDSFPSDCDTGFLAMADIDHFKMINDTYGHNAGDEVLKCISHTMSELCRNCEISRWGGEEFLILSSRPVAGIKEMLEYLRKTIEDTPVMYNDKEIRVTITIGYTIRKKGQDIESWIQETDSKLYYGKNNGRNRVIE